MREILPSDSQTTWPEPDAGDDPDIARPGERTPELPDDTTATGRGIREAGEQPDVLPNLDPPDEQA